MTSLPLPQLSSAPTPHPHACPCLSKTLLSHIASSVPPFPSPPVILSIGSGTGLPEALLASHHRYLQIYGVELSSVTNLYLRPSQLLLPSPLLRGAGGREPLPDLEDPELDLPAFGTWLWVYLRDRRLLSAWIGRWGGGDVRRMVFVGPLYEDVRGDEVLEAWGSEVRRWEGADGGVGEGEFVSIWERG